MYIPILIFKVLKTADFRKGIPGLMGLCKKYLKQDPFSGALFVFRNKKENSIKSLIYDGQGFWLIMKKFSSGRLKWWPKNSKQIHQVTANELQIILAKGEPNKADLGKDYIPIKPIE